MAAPSETFIRTGHCEFDELVALVRSFLAHDVLDLTIDGQRIRGVKKNEDAFSVQIMDTHERIQGYVKSDLKEVIDDETSVMPDFGADRVSDRDLADLVAYLQGLR